MICALCDLLAFGSCADVFAIIAHTPSSAVAIPINEMLIIDASFRTKWADWLLVRIVPSSRRKAQVTEGAVLKQSNRYTPPES